MSDIRHESSRDRYNRRDDYPDQSRRDRQYENGPRRTEEVDEFGRVRRDGGDRERERYDDRRDSRGRGDGYNRRDRNDRRNGDYEQQQQQQQQPAWAYSQDYKGRPDTIRRRPGESHDEWMERRRLFREESKYVVWPPSPLDDRRSVSPSPSRESKKKSKRKDSEDESDSGSESDRDRKKKSKHKKHKSSSKKKSKKKSKSSKKKHKRSRSSSSDSPSSSEESEVEDGRARGRSGSVSAGERDGVIKQQEVDPTIEDYWAEKKPHREEEPDTVGPMPLPKDDGQMDSRAYGSNLLAGEGAALAAYVQSGKRIPRRGEVGLQPEQIESFEKVGYVMSGSRHHRMNAVRLRKENQVISAEEKRALVTLKKEETIKKENQIIANFKEMLSEKFKEAQ